MKELPAEIAEAALCAQTDPEAFFPERGGTPEPAKAICGTCPVVAACLDYALETHQHYGIWGGTSADQRRTLRRPPNRTAA